MEIFSFNSDIIEDKLKKALMLRELYSSYGYRRYSSNKFDRYDFYSRHKDFLVCKNIISFSDTDGTLMALSPDMTLSVINSSRDNLNSVNRLYYDEDVFRVSEFSGKFKCYRQVGLECFGKIIDKDYDDVVVLAVSTLSMFDEKFILAISDVNIILKVIKTLKIPEDSITNILELVRSKNIDEIENTLNILKINSNKAKLFLSLLQLDNLDMDSCRKEAKKICGMLDSDSEFDLFDYFVKRFEKTKYCKNIQLDFSQIGDVNYYSGICFNGFVSGVGEVVLKGGQYDHILSKLSKSGKAIGFAVYLNRLFA